MLLLSRLESMAIIINNRIRFLIWCYSHKLLCFSIYESIGWRIVLFRFVSFDLVLWFCSILDVVQYTSLHDIEDIPFLISDHWAVCLWFGDLHSSLPLSFSFSFLDISLCPALYRARALIMHVKYYVLRCNVYLLRM